MIELAQSLQNKDTGFLRIVANLWGIKLPKNNSGDQTPRHLAIHLAQAMLGRDPVANMVSFLPADARMVLDELAIKGGQLPWQAFVRQFGGVREMGAARRDREQPHLKPASTAEVLWYRAFISRAFLDTPNGAVEFAFIPADLLTLLPEPEKNVKITPGRVAAAAERAVLIPAHDNLLDHTCTLLAAIRLGLSYKSSEFLSASWDLNSINTPRPEQLQALLTAAGLLDHSEAAEYSGQQTAEGALRGLPNPETSRRHLELPRDKALAQLTRAWMHSPDFNDLRLTPGLDFEGEWRNDPLRARYTILEFLTTVPRNTWWSLTAFIESIKETEPDFQRPAGDYDSWYIRNRESGEFIHGFESWDAVEGALIRFILTGPLHWLGILDLAAPGENRPASAFRFSRWADALLKGTSPEGLEIEDNEILVSSDARIRVPRRVPRIARYQLARLCHWDNAYPDAYAYRLTPASLERARAQGLQVSHLLTLLRRSALVVPPALIKALERWETSGSEARLERALILRVRSPEILQMLRSSRAARFLGEPLGPTAIIVKASAGTGAGASEKVLAMLAELGYLSDGAEEVK